MYQNVTLTIFMETKSITIETVVSAPIETVWNCWTQPEHITKWTFASDDWEAPEADNDLRIGGTFRTLMSAKDKSATFEFGGVYTNVKKHELIEYEMEDGRKVSIVFIPTNEGIKVTETFDMESENSEELQRNGWQSILDNFKMYVQRHGA